MHYLRVLLCLLFCVCVYEVHAQIEEPVPMGSGEDIDSLRRREETDTDSVEYTAKYIRYTTLRLLNDSTHTIQIDTSLANLQNFSPIDQPRQPTIGLGNMGLAYRPLLFVPDKKIGFDAGFHSLDAYKLTQDSLKYFRARSPYSELYYVNGTMKEQIFRVTHAQNIKPNWSFGAFYNRMGSDGFYANQRADHLNAAINTWYESPGKRYNLLVNGLFNTLKAAENGSTTNDSIFTVPSSLGKISEQVRFAATDVNRSRQTWREKGFFIRQMYYLGRIDTLNTGNDTEVVRPTQRVAHSLSYTSNSFKYFRNELDRFSALPHFLKRDTTPNANPPFIPADDLVMTNDSTIVKDLMNEFTYSFYLRGRSLSFIKNEVKLDLGMLNNIYWYSQNGRDTLRFHNTTLKAALGYRFSDRVSLTADLRQLVTGRNAGDYLYDAKTSFLLSNSIGRIVLGAYIENKSPEMMFEKVSYQYHWWGFNFEKTKTTNLSFQYDNPKYRFFAKAEYFLIANHLYYSETFNKFIVPVQADKNISMLQVSGGKKFSFGKFKLDSYLIYQITNLPSIIRTPEVYTYSSFYYDTQLLRGLHTNIGIDLRYNTPYTAPAYAIGVSQFYNDIEAVEFKSYPLADVWIKATVRRANLFLKYGYANQGLFSKGYYTVNKYPMGDALLRFGVAWKFYN